MGSKLDLTHKLNNKEVLLRYYPKLDRIAMPSWEVHGASEAAAAGAVLQNFTLLQMVPNIPMALAFSLLSEIAG
jgi:hypothetical protein